MYIYIHTPLRVYKRCTAMSHHITSLPEKKQVLYLYIIYITSAWQREVALPPGFRDTPRILTR